MKVQTFSVVGAALNFGARRMETIMRVAWLPIVLLLVVEMATVFSYLSAAVGRFISFSDVLTFAEAESALGRLFFKGWQTKPEAMAAIMGASVAVQAILVASFMAPLIRYAGLDERPAPGVVKLAFGGDQIRFLLAGFLSFLIVAAFIYAPIGATAYYVIQYIVDALSQTYARFPNPDSLHTIELVSAQQTLAERGGMWLYNLGIPLAAAAPFALVFWLVLVGHFHPKNRDGAEDRKNLVQRATTVLVALSGVIVVVWFALLMITKTKLESPGSYIYAIVALAAAIACYANLRLWSYQGVVVCRRSMAFAGTLSVSRGWNLLRLFAAVVLTLAIVFTVQFLINAYLFVLILQAVNLLYAATLTATKLTNSGEGAAWVWPTFIWVWNGVKIIVNIFIAFFSYGVSAGLLGRLYRASERADA